MDKVALSLLQPRDNLGHVPKDQTHPPYCSSIRKLAKPNLRTIQSITEDPCVLNKITVSNKEPAAVPVSKENDRERVHLKVLYHFLG